MARKDEDKNIAFIIPQNYRESNVTGNGIPWRNVAEGVVLAGIVAVIVCLIPMKISTKIVVGVILGGILMLLAIRGHNNCSLSEYLIDFIKFKL